MTLEDRIFKLVQTQKFTVDDLRGATGASGTRIKRILKDLDVVSEGGGKQRTFYLPTAPLPISAPYIEKQLGIDGIVALTGDWHGASNYERLDLQDAFLEHCVSEGVSVLYDCGDVTDGFGLYRGHLTQVKEFGTDKQALHVIKHRPGRPSITQKFISGNHDLAAMRQTGVDVGNLIVNGVTVDNEFFEGRKDMVYLGQQQRDVLIHGCKIRLLHPQSKKAYAKSYWAQRYVQDIRGGRKPNMLCLGHEHDSMYFVARNVHVFKVGSLQDETEYTLTKGIEPNLGGWIVEYKIRNGGISSIKSQWIPFYE